MRIKSIKSILCLLPLVMGLHDVTQAQTYKDQVLDSLLRELQVAKEDTNRSKVKTKYWCVIKK